MAVTLRDVAKAAGVSPMAASKTLHGGSEGVRISEPTAVRIREAARALGYVPNRVARNLRGGRTHTIGLVFESLGPFATGSRYHALLLDGVSQACFGRGYALSLCPTIAKAPVAAYGDGRFDGVIWARYLPTIRTLDEIAALSIPVAMMHAPPSFVGDRPIVHACCDNAQGMALAVEHLAQLGHREIAFVTERGQMDNPETLDRIEGLGLFAERWGMRVEVRPAEDDYGLSGTIVEWLAVSSVTGIILRTESLAPDVYEAARILGKEVPRDLSVVGFDSTEYCDRLTPPLTSVRQPIEELANRLALTLIETIERRQPAVRGEVLPCDFDERGSTLMPRHLEAFG